MKVLAAILCAEVVPPEDGGITLVRVSDSIHITDFSAPAEFAYYFALMADPADTGIQAVLAVEVVDPDAEVIAMDETRFTWQHTRTPGRESVVVHARNVAVVFEQPGPHEVRLRVNGRISAARTLEIRRAE